MHGSGHGEAGKNSDRSYVLGSNNCDTMRRGHKGADERAFLRMDHHDTRRFFVLNDAARPQYKVNIHGGAGSACSW